ncbi:MAG: hypothetical protein CL569_06310 [Alphaproteobacteria bacterium]|nr:hypothetical protein [Alphaproteobacteria bacterium]|tara:strand:+ start:18864 stop:19382 length:519 start_codon:yes stop_codon:yes gene_type:complete
MIGKVFVGALVVLLVVAPHLVRAQTPKEIGSYRAWRAYVYNEANGNKVCFMDSEPADTEPKNVRRGQIYTLVTHRPGDKVRDEVSIFVGYPFKEGSTVKVTITDKEFTLFTDADSAWNYDARGDKNMVNAMIKGNVMIVEGRSKRGTNTRDRYSLSGFTAAHKAISKACGVK